MQQIYFNPKTMEFHLQNDRISYILCVLANGHLGHLYFGKRLRNRQSFQHLVQLRSQSHTQYVFPNDYLFSLDVVRQEYPCYGSGDYREPAFELLQENGSRISDFVYKSHRIYTGKERLEGLPACYAEADEVHTLEITLEDALLQSSLTLSYSIYDQYDVICRSVRLENHGTQCLTINRMLSMSIDLYDSDFDMVHLDGAWARERHISSRPLTKGIQSISSARGASSADHNPFLVLKRRQTTESMGECYGFCLIYSGNFLAQVEVDRYDVARVGVGIHPFGFCWKLKPGESFQSPECVAVYSAGGLNGMSQNLHGLFNRRLVRGTWRERERPILLNNWEATYFKFDEEKLLGIAGKAKELGVELFVLDDGWFGKRNDATSSLGDWYSDRSKLPEGVEGLSRKIEALGLKFGLWIEPEMVNEDSNLYRAHPEWVVSVPGRRKSLGRSQYVLDYSNPEVVDAIFRMLETVFAGTRVSYIKWDMNRNITEAFGSSLPEERQGEFFHRYILGVYALYERLIARFPETLFESCASGGCRFDAGMLYYAPQCWASDDTDAVERIKIQYGTTLAYPVASMGAHISAVPNHQVSRNTSLQMRCNVAYFGAFGYELDPNALSQEEQQQIREQIAFYKKYRKLIQFGDFYRLKSPFENQGDAAWMVVSRDRKTAVVASYKVLATPNPPLKRLLLQGLNPSLEYGCTGRKETYFGDELMNLGFLTDLEYTGSTVRAATDRKNCGIDRGDFTSQLFVLKAVE